jgi:hypothetical protein
MIMTFRMRDLLPRALFVLTVAAGMLLANENANGMSCDRLTAAEHIANTELIFFGRVKTVRSRELAESQGVTDWYEGFAEPDTIATFDVLRRYKGTDSKTVDIQFYGDDGKVAGWGFQRGRYALVFARKVTSADTTKTIGHLTYCDMIPYYAADRLLPDYWEILVPLSKDLEGK